MFVWDVTFSRSFSMSLPDTGRLTADRRLEVLPLRSIKLLFFLSMVVECLEARTGALADCAMTRLLVVYAFWIGSLGGFV